MEPLASAVTVLAVMQLFGLSIGGEAYAAAVASAVIIVKILPSDRLLDLSKFSLGLLLIGPLLITLCCAFVMHGMALGRSCTFLLLGASAPIGFHVVLHSRLTKTDTHI